MPACDVLQQVFATLPLTGSDGSAEKFLAVPGVGEPRWLLPEACRNLDSVLSSWAPYRFSSRLKWRAIRAANRVGAAHLLPNSGTTQTVNAANTDWRCMGWSGGAPPLPVIYVGTPGVSRKAVVHLVDRESGRCDAIVKVPLAEAAKRAILREAGMLASLAEEKYTCAPRLLHVDHEHGVATQTFIPGISGERRFSAPCGDLLQSLVLKDETTTIAQHANAMEESVACDSHSRIVRAAIAELNDTHLLPACWVHGDFAPWNIKQKRGNALMLIDWEDARRGGLPLQDYYHFLHMQDYLFGQRPTIHSTAAEDLARRIGVTATQCRKLEIAYLSDSYLKSIAEEKQSYADFLLETIGLALRARPRALVISKQGIASPHVADRQSANHSQQIRSQLLEAMIAQFNSAGIQYCVLSGYDDEAATGASDVDIMVDPRDMPSIPALLALSARSAGGLLIQAIQHEITGCYFVLAKQDGRQTGSLDPDCCSDYRRNGRLWMSGGEVIAGRRRYQDFYVPPVADEFTYYLLKKVLKQSITVHQLERLKRLYSSDSAGCQGRLARFWPQTTALAIQRALLEPDLAWFSKRLPALLLELNRSAPVEPRFNRYVGTLRELVRRLRRALYPTGMSVLVTGGESSLRSKVGDGLLQNLSPAFRRTAKAPLTNGFLSSLSCAARTFCSRRRSTLVVGIGNSDHAAKGLRRVWPVLSRLLFRPDLLIALKPEILNALHEPTLRAAGNPSSPHRLAGTVHIDVNLPLEQIVADGTGVVLNWMAARLERRLPGSRPSADIDVSLDHISEPVALRSAGLD